MTPNSLNEEARTPWIPMALAPVREGAYELRHVQDRVVLAGYYSAGVWRFKYDGNWTKLVLPKSKWEWRGLAAPAKPQRRLLGWSFDWRTGEVEWTFES